MATKRNNLLQILPSNALIFSSWMSTQGISRAEQSSYVQTGWLEKLTHGVYYNRGGRPTLSAAISSYDDQLNKTCFVGASTALDLRGFSHFVAMGKPFAYLFSSTKERLQESQTIKPLAKDKSLNERQKKALNYVKENGSITNKIYQELNGVSKPTSTRDLTELVTMTILEIEGKGRNLQYVQSAHNRLNSVHVLSYSRLLLIFNFNARQ